MLYWLWMDSQVQKTSGRGLLDKEGESILHVPSPSGELGNETIVKGTHPEVREGQRMPFLVAHFVRTFNKSTQQISENEEQI